MKHLFATTALFAILMAPGFSRADSRPKLNNPIGHAKPASTTFEGSPTAGMYKWENGVAGPISGLNMVNTTVYTNRDGVVVDTCIVVANGCTGEVPHDITITDSDFYLNKPATGGNFPWAVQVIQGHHVILDGVRAHNFRMVAVNGHYENGDCFDAERGDEAKGTGAYDILYSHTLCDGASDGGYDFKADHVVFDDAAAQKVDICARAWGSATGGTFACSAWGPSSSGAAFQVIKLPGSNGTKGYLHLGIVHVTATAGLTQKFFNLQYAGSTLILDGCWGPMPANDGKNKLGTYEQGATPANTTLQLGPGCALGDNYPDPAAVAIAEAPPPVAAKPFVCSPILYKDGSGNGTITFSSKTAASDKALGVKAGTVVKVSTEAAACGHIYDLVK